MVRLRDSCARAALALSLALPVYFLVAALGTKFGLIPWAVGFGAMSVQWGPRLMMLALALGVVALLLSFLVWPRRGVLISLLAIAIPAAGLGYGWSMRQVASSVPPIHDISTDVMEPPEFSGAVVAARGPGANSLDLLSKRAQDGRAFIALQQQAYPDITSIPTGLSTGAAFDLALALAREQSWTLGKVDRDAGVIEAAASSFWYGFTDDIAVRVRLDGAGARIDMRSVSRVGHSDLGANAKRMRPYLAELRRRLEEAEG